MTRRSFLGMVAAVVAARNALPIPKPTTPLGDSWLMGYDYAADYPVFYKIDWPVGAVWNDGTVPRLTQVISA